MNLPEVVQIFVKAICIDFHKQILLYCLLLLTFSKQSVERMWPFRFFNERAILECDLAKPLVY